MSPRDWGSRRTASMPGSGSSAEKHEAASAAEIRKLKTELRRVTEERDILKKTAKYFAGESG